MNSSETGKITDLYESYGKIIELDAPEIETAALFLPAQELIGAVSLRWVKVAWSRASKNIPVAHVPVVCVPELYMRPFGLSMLVQWAERRAREEHSGLITINTQDNHPELVDAALWSDFTYEHGVAIKDLVQDGPISSYLDPTHVQ